MRNPFGNGDDDNNNFLPLPPNYATVVNKKTGQIRIAKVGFSWTSLLFDILPALFRQDWYNALCMLFIQWGVAMGIATFTQVPITPAYYEASWALSIIWGAFYNLMYFRHLFKKGYVPANKASAQLLIQNGYLKNKN